MTKSHHLARIRREYRLHALDGDSVDPDPFIQFRLWMEEAMEAVEEDANAMCLSTSGQTGRPSSRMVLLKGFDERGLVFFTNYKSRKGSEISDNPNVSVTFYWKELERQVRIAGRASLVSSKESDEYFQSRPLNSRLSAAVSPQSQVIPSREWLEERMKNLAGISGDRGPARPPEWGGYRIRPAWFEFWQGRESRLHDRILYARKKGKWEISRLAP